MIDAKVHGVQDVRDALRALPGKLRVRALRNALAAGARVVQRAVRSAAPVLQLKTRGARYMYRKGYRKPGTLRKAISVRTSKVARRAGNVGVFVNVRPAKGGQRGARNWRDPYYWRWVAFGHKIVERFKGKYTDYALRGRGRKTGLAKRRRAATGFVPGRNFLAAGGGALSAALHEFNRRIGPMIQKLNRPKAPAP